MPTRISMGRALQRCAAGIAYWMRDGRLRYRTMPAGNRQGSDVYVDRNQYRIYRKEYRPNNALSFGPSMPIGQWERIETKA
jgi:hypothetical protein